jgi:tetratricopeptide (TPR) repeat protein
MLTLINSRPEYVPSWNSLVPVMRLELSRLDDRMTSALVQSALGDASFPPELIDEIVHRSDGVPLFAEELATAVLRSRDDGPGLSKLTIPASLQDSLTARLDRLGSAKEVAQTGAVIGREFTHTRLAGAMSIPASELADDIDQLVRAGIVFRRGIAPGVSYTFKHALTRDAAYNSLLSSRRAHLHARVAAMLEVQEPDTLAAQPELLAYHQQEAGDQAKAFSYWTAAGDLAASRSAAVEAAKHYRSAIELIPALAAGDEARSDTLEFSAQMRLGGVLFQTEGYTSRAGLQCFETARRLASTLGEPDKYVKACAGMSGVLLSVGRISAAIEVFEDSLLKDPSNLEQASRLSLAAELGHAKLLRGEFEQAWKVLGGAFGELDLKRFDRLKTPGAAHRATFIVMMGARVRMHQGHFSEARAMFASALEFARRVGQATPLAMALSAAAILAHQLGAVGEARRYVEELCELCEQQGFKGWLGSGQFMLGLLALESGQVDEGMTLLRDGHATWEAWFGRINITEFAALSADALLVAGQIRAADEYVTLGEAAQREGEERLVEAELQRLRGRLQMIAGDSLAAEERLRSAVEIAERQGVKRISLRTATDLANLLAARGCPAEAREVIEPIYRWFPEDLSNPDLFRAKEVLWKLTS